jgi:hypothetical protein
MPTVAARIELELQLLKFGALVKVWVACSEVQRQAKEERTTLHRPSPPLELRSSAEPVFWPVQAPATLAAPPVKRSASRCARYGRREVKSSTVSATKGWKRIRRSNTMRQRAQSPERSSEEGLT